MIYFRVNGFEICARVDPSAAMGAGETMRLRANHEQMHLIDAATNIVI
jgi:multiple sugar transport system ATP-binding protein